jgi:hypothetical protein
VDRFHESVDCEQRRSTVEHGHRLGGGSPKNSRNGAPVRGTSPRLREKGEGTAVSLTGGKRGRQRLVLSKCRNKMIMQGNNKDKTVTKG